jgi:arsenate reductase (glutaredoxin)
MTITLYGIPNCDTVKKARAWLSQQRVEYQFHDFKKQGVPSARLDRWIEELGWEKLVNRNGTTWRKLPVDVQGRVTDAASAAQVMRENVSVIKRPVVEWGKNPATVGFDAAEWTQRLT